VAETGAGLGGGAESATAVADFCCVGTDLLLASKGCRGDGDGYADDQKDSSPGVQGAGVIIAVAGVALGPSGRNGTTDAQDATAEVNGHEIVEREIITSGKLDALAPFV
jgi:hypothetical protein